MSMLVAAAGGAVHMYTQFLKVGFEMLLKSVEFQISNQLFEFFVIDCLFSQVKLYIQGVSQDFKSGHSK